MTRRRILLLAVLVFSFMWVACQPTESVPRSLSEDDIATLQRATEQYRDAELVNDWAAVTMLYTENAIRMLPDMPAIQGRDAILQEFEARPYSVAEYDQRIEETDGLTDLAFVRGVFSFTVDFEGELSSGTGKYISIYRHQPDGTWLIDRDIWNLDKASP